MSAAFSLNTSGRGTSSQNLGAPKLTPDLSAISLTSASEIILTKTDLALEPNAISHKLIQWLNIYPHPGIVAIGSQSFPTHDRVDKGLREYLQSESTFSNEHQLSDLVAGFRDGNKYIVRIDGLSDEILRDYSSNDFQVASQAAAKINQQLIRYETAIQIATVIAEKSGGKVILQADLESQQLIAKILGRLHQVDTDYMNAGPEGIRKKIKSFGGIRHIYDTNKGTRYFFLDDLESYANKIADNGSHEETQHTLYELVHFFTERNPRGYRHGKPFLVEPNGKTPVLSDKVYQEFADEVTKVLQLINSSAISDWHNCRSKISSSLIKSIKSLKESYSHFHSINLDSSEFVNVFYANLQGSTSKLDLGKDFSTPLSAQELGRFAIDQTGRRFFEIQNKDIELSRIASWLVSDQGEADLIKLGSQLKPSEADYITCYTPDTPLTFEPHPTEFVKRFGHIEPKSYVFEFGRAGETPERWVIEENVWSSANWEKRTTTTARLLKEQFSTAQLSIAVKQTKDDQQRLFASLLLDSSAQLAEEYQWRTIPHPPESWGDFYNYRIRRFVPGKRADDTQLMQMNTLELARLMEPLGKLIAAGIIGQLPHLPRRDTIISTTPNGTATLTLLSPGESFCQSHRARNVTEYLNDFVPQMYGNLLAQWLTPVSRATSEHGEDVRNSTRQALLKQCLKSMRKALKSVTSVKTYEGRDFRKKLAETYQEHARLRNTNYLPKELSITTFLPFTEKILGIDKESIRRISNRISRAVMNELALIDRLAPPPKSSSSIDQWSAFEECSTAASSLIERHLPEAKKFRRTIDLLKDISTKYDLLEVRERAWYISLLDIDTRARELGKRKILTMLAKQAVDESANEHDFYRKYSKIGEGLDLPYESVIAYYRAVLGLRASLQTEILDRGLSERVKQLRMALGRLNGENQP